MPNEVYKTTVWEVAVFVLMTSVIYGAGMTSDGMI
jgi:hypothetical protein